MATKRKFAAMTALLLGASGFENIPAHAAMQPSGASEPLPSDFRGRITYQGTHGATLDRGPRRGSREYGGALTIELTFEGNSVRGRFSGTGGINSGTMSGTRSGSQCRLFEDRAGDIIEGECSRTRFDAVARSQNARNAMAARFEGQATQFADARIEEQQRQVAAAEAAQRRREQEAAYAALPNAGPALTRRLDTYVQADSQGWVRNRYSAGSMTDVKIVDGTVRSGNFVMRGSYTFNGGSRGWVMAKMTNGQLECIQFWDSMTGCRGLRTAADGQAIRNAITGAILGGSDGGSAGSDSNVAANQDFITAQQIQAQTQRQIENMRPPN